MSLNWFPCMSGRGNRGTAASAAAAAVAGESKASRCKAKRHSQQNSCRRQQQQQQFRPPSPIPVPTGRRPREVKEDSGCYMSESHKSQTQAAATGPASAPAHSTADRRSVQEDSGICSGELSCPVQQPQPQPLQPHQQHHQQHQDHTRVAAPSILDFNNSGGSFSQCVPKLPNRQAPFNNNGAELRRLAKAKELEIQQRRQQQAAGVAKRSK